ncbi:hypothetical protein JNUCC1_00933 [Lentibacillus sp. JNUCC-1]|uniref:DUF6119 family protein n=1 Tax=Lentibacillus sp. JNUCC-1 TaxID=2654513 RepID=UPI0012E9916B|nr:DUF6119 family protein [Lentibacillus sp. JNUCC-1]MUV37127.1 hypothetical protein [Lentibacillus sp. JNUCC-1]
MSASHFTIYRLYGGGNWQSIINDFNEGKDEEEHLFIHTNREYRFRNISAYSLYTSVAKTSPNWGATLSELVNDLGEIENIRQSFVLFLKVGDESFAATGGNGYQVLEGVKDYNFGLELLSRLISQNDDVIKRVNDRYFTGNILGGNYQYNRRVTINTEADFNNFFNEIYVALPSDKITKKLGINITTKKKDYRFLAKDSIQLGKAMTLKELDSMLGSVLGLLKAQGYDINPFYRLNDKDHTTDELDMRLVQGFTDYLSGENFNVDFSIIPFYEVYDTHYMKINDDPETTETYETENDIAELFKKHVDLDKEAEDILSIIKNTYLTAKVENNEEAKQTLYEHLDVKVRLDDASYWLMNGNWYKVGRSFIDELNKHFVNKVTTNFDHEFKLNKVHTWPDKESEGDYNFCHNEIASIFVLDKILYRNIEICDLLYVEDDAIYFIHVKDGLSGDVRVLVNQIEDAMRVLQDGLEYDIDTLKEFYESIVQKIKSDNESQTQQSRAAQKFISHFQCS